MRSETVRLNIILTKDQVESLKQIAGTRNPKNLDAIDRAMKIHLAL